LTAELAGTAEPSIRGRRIVCVCERAGDLIAGKLRDSTAGFVEKEEAHRYRSIAGYAHVL
jgi:hypothetical protein